MNEIQRGVLTLLKSAVTGQALPLPEGFSLEEAMPVIKKHQIVPLAYEGAVNCGVDTKSPPMQQLLQWYCQSLLFSEQQMLDVERIFAAFDANGIDYMPLKGCNMKKRYPKPELRQMGDADILIRMEQYSKIRPIMQQLGFEEKQESDHDLTWQSKRLHLELHKRLIPSYNKDYYAYFGDGWCLAKQQAGSRWAMSPEDELIYLFTHFAKHYRDGGIGCRHLLDLWVYRRSCKDLQEAYIRKELKKLQLDVFYDNICRVLAVWFGDGQPDEITRQITRFLWDSGSWGQQISHVLSVELKNAPARSRHARRNAFLRTIFPDAQQIQYRYPILQKAPYLLPVIWPVRWVDILLFRGNQIQARRKVLQTVTDDSVEAYRRSLERVGLAFRFEEK